jgi:hypothetical protein
LVFRTYGTYCTVGFTQNRDTVAQVFKKMYVECTKYVRRHTPAKASSRQPETTNKRTMAKASRFCYLDISFISWPNHMFEMRKSIGSICSGHPLTSSPLYNIVVRLCQFLVLAGNRFWFYIIIVQYNCGVVLVFGPGGK